MNFIEKLQNRPRYIRIQILWISVILVMTIIIFIWLIFLRVSLNFSETKKEFVEEKQQAAPSLFEILKEDLSVFKKGLQAGIKGILENSESEKKIEFEAGIKTPQPSKLPE